MVRAPLTYRDSSLSTIKAENSCETLCLTQDGLGVFLLTQPLPEDSEKRSCRALRTEDGASSYCTGTQSQDFMRMLQEGLRVINIHRGNENHPGSRQVTDTAGLTGGEAAPSPGRVCPRWAAALGESRGEQAQGLVLVGRQGGAVAVEVAGDAAAGGARAVTERLYASLSLKLCKGERAGPG